MNEIFSTGNCKNGDSLSYHKVLEFDLRSSFIPSWQSRLGSTWSQVLFPKFLFFLENAIALVISWNIVYALPKTIATTPHFEKSLLESISSAFCTCSKAVFKVCVLTAVCRVLRRCDMQVTWFSKLGSHLLRSRIRRTGRWFTIYHFWKTKQQILSSTYITVTYCWFIRFLWYQGSNSI